MTDNKKALQEEFEQFVQDNPDIVKKVRNKISHAQSVANYNKKTYNSFSVHLRDKEYNKVEQIISARPAIGKSSLIMILLAQLSTEEMLKMVDKKLKEDHPDEDSE